MKIGIYSVSSQSGRAYLADMLMKGHSVYGYARTSSHGTEFVNAVNQNGGIRLERPVNSNGESNTFLNFNDDSSVGHSLKELIDYSEVIFLAVPSNYLPETVQLLKDAGIKEKKIPLITAPPRSFATPYLWQTLGHLYPIVSFSTCPYSCKAPAAGVAYIKRRKRTWFASFEGTFTKKQISDIKALYPQVVFNSSPLTTTLGNIGAIFHPATYLLNYEDILKAQTENRIFSFYMDGIYKKSDVGRTLEQIDQIRLAIADKLGAQTYGLENKPNEEEWQELTKSLYDENIGNTSDLHALHKLRHDVLNKIGNAVVSSQHWLDYTYGVKRIPGETLSDAIGRTPTYQKNSVPQSRYVTEDIPSSLVPLSAFAKRLGIDSKAMDDIISLYESRYERPEGAQWRDLEGFSTEYLIDYLNGCFFEEI